MQSHLTPRCRRLLLALPLGVRVAAYRAYAQFRRDPTHPGLNFKLVNQREQMWSARINDQYRALGYVMGQSSPGSGSASTTSTSGSFAGDLEIAKICRLRLLDTIRA
jgi:hypothetical protein